MDSKWNSRLFSGLVVFCPFFSFLDCFELDSLAIGSLGLLRTAGIVEAELDALLNKIADSVVATEMWLGRGDGDRDSDLGESKVLMSIWVSFSTKVLNRSSFLFAFALPDVEPTAVAIGLPTSAETVCGPPRMCFAIDFKHETRWVTRSCFSASRVE